MIGSHVGRNALWISKVSYSSQSPHPFPSAKNRKSEADRFSKPVPTVRQTVPGLETGV